MASGGVETARNCAELFPSCSNRFVHFRTLCCAVSGFAWKGPKVFEKARNCAEQFRAVSKPPHAIFG
eukprot:15431987-Alexandrium_andersonii.AAC.1